MSKDTTASDVAFIQALAEMLSANELTEISVKREYGDNDTLNVKVSKQVIQIAAPAPMAPAPAPAPAPSATGSAAAAAPGQNTSDDPAEHPGAVTSPMVGTAYLSPEPGSEPFVALGHQVNAGETLMIIEAMKTMNHIPAPASGTVKRILVTDGTPVEFGAPLMIIE